MRHGQGYIQNRTGDATAGIEVYIKKQSDSSLVDLFSDESGLVPIANPLTTDNDGEYSFFTANNTLKIEAKSEGVTIQTLPYEQHYDLSVVTSFGWSLIDDANAAAAATTLGLGTGDSPQFTAINLGHTSDTTFTRVSAGTAAIEGQNILTAATGQPLDATLTALAAYNTNGLLTQTAADTFAGRTITGTANEITVADGNGVSANPTLSLPSALTFTGKTITGGSVTPAATPTTTAVGYLGSPINTQDATYTTVMSDAGKTIYHTSASTHTWTIDSNANVAYPIGTQIGFSNENGGGDVTIAITSDTLRWGSSTGSRTLSANGSAVAQKMTSTLWRLTGDGIA
jgi:hypothetical protein